MKIMIDLNVVLDVVQKRVPHYYASAAVLSKVLNKEAVGFLPGHALTTISYLVNKYANQQQANEVVDWLLNHFEIRSANKSHFIRAQSLAMDDFEDAVVASLAEAAECDCIVTRNASDFEKSPVIALTPDEFLKRTEVDSRQ